MTLKWFAFEHVGPVMRRHHLYIDGKEAGLFIDQNRYHYDAKYTLHRSGGHPSGCASTLEGSAIIAPLKRVAENIARQEATA